LSIKEKQDEGKKGIGTFSSGTVPLLEEKVAAPFFCNQGKSLKNHIICVDEGLNL